MNKAASLFIVNKALPDSDYRLDYGARSQVCEVFYGLPERSALPPAERFVRIGFEEGLHPGVITALWDLHRYLRSRRGRLAFVHFYTTNPILLGPIVARLAGVPCVITFTGFGRVMSSTDRKYTLVRPLYSLLLRHAIRAARLVLFQNKADHARLSRSYPGAAHKFHYVGSTSGMAVTEDKDFSTPGLTVLLATRLMPEKGVPDFIAVARELHGPRFRFRLAGPASRGHEGLYKEVLAAAQEGVLEYDGNLESPAMEAALEQAHILLFPSYYGEGLSRLMLEAGFAQLCPVAYNIPSNRDLVVEGGGFLVEPGDRQQIILILSSLADDRALVASHAACYQEHVLQHYGRQQYAERLDDLFRAMLSKLDS